jgi:hypothetical protein
MLVGALTCLIVGAGLERVRQAVLEPIPEVAPLPEAPFEVRERGPNLSAQTTDDATVRAAMDLLRRRVAELEKLLKARETELAELKKHAPDAAITSRRPRRDDFRQRMEQLKKENPTLYAEMEKRREEFRTRMEQEKQDRDNFLASVNTASMSDDQKANHEKLLETLAKIEALRAQREQAGTDPGSEDETTRQSMGQLMSELGALYEVERQYLLEQAAYAAGYEGNDADNFVDYIQETIQSTTMHRGHGGPPPGM